MHNKSGALIQVPTKKAEVTRDVRRRILNMFPNTHVIGWSYYLQNIDRANNFHDLFIQKEINRTPEGFYWHRKHLGRTRVEPHSMEHRETHTGSLEGICAGE